MLTRNYLELVAPLAATAANKGYVARSAQNSPLDLLCSATMACLSTQPLVNTYDIEEQGERIDTLVDNFYQSTQPTMGVSSIELSGHGRTLDNEVAMLTSRIRPLVRFIPNVVNPIIRELVESVSTGLSQVTPDGLIGKKIEVIRFPRFLTSTEFATRLTVYGGREYSFKTKLGAGIPRLSQQEILERMKTGLTTVDAEINQWLKNEGTSQLTQLVDTVFGVAASSAEGDMALSMLFGDRKQGLYNALVVFVLSNNFLADIPEETRMAPGIYREQLETFRSIAGYSLYTKLKTLLRKREENVLVEGYDNNTVFVYEDIYDKFLEQGGTNEMLLGAYMSSNRSYRIEAVLDKAEEYNRNWQQALVAIRASERDHKTIIQEKLMNEHFHRIMLESFSEQDMAQVDIAGMCRTFAKTYRELHPNERSDLATAATNAVCEARFPQSPAKDILLNMQQIMRDNPEITAENASGMAFAIYISDWVADLVRLEAVS